MITFIENDIPGYPPRTRKNIQDTDLTIAFATDFNSPGERLTKSIATNLKKLYIPWEINKGHILDVRDIEGVVAKIKAHFILNLSYTINIAGNSLSRLKLSGYDQKEVDFGMHIFINSLKGFIDIAQVITGGQSGIDEAGTKGADKLGIPTIVRAPKGWMFRNEKGFDIKNEKLFKERFKI